MLLYPGNNIDIVVFKRKKHLTGLVVWEVLFLLPPKYNLILIIAIRSILEYIYMTYNFEKVLEVRDKQFRGRHPHSVQSMIFSMLLEFESSVIQIDLGKEVLRVH